MNEIRLAVRTLLRTPGFTLAAVLTLGLGIGLNTAVFSLVNPILFRPLPFREPDRLVYLNEINPAQGFTKDRMMNVSYADFVDWRQRNRVFEDVGVYQSAAWTLAGRESADRVAGATVSATLFELLGVRPWLGRGFQEGEDAPGAERVVLLGYGLWQRSFGGEAGVLGETVALDGISHTVVGVMPAGFRFPNVSELWTPLVVAAPERQRGSFSNESIARLKPGITLEQAREDLARLSRELTAEHPGENAGVTAYLEPLRLGLAGDFALMSWVLLGAVGFVMAVACANVANLFLSRALSRQREWAVRSALGGSRWRLLRPLLTEGLLLAGVAGLAGLLFSQAGVKAAVASIPVEIPYWLTFDLDGRVLVFTLAVALASCLLFALAPAWHVVGRDCHEDLKGGTRGSGEGRRRSRMRRVLVAGEVALALLLMSGTGVMVLTFLNLQRADPGFDSSGVWSCGVHLWAPEYGDAARQARFYDQLVARVGELPGVGEAAAVSNLPMGGANWGMSFTLEGRPAPQAGETPVGNMRVVTPGYFATMKIPLLRGRDFGESDRGDGRKVAIIDATLARQFFPDANPVGGRLKLGRFESTNEWVEIVGVAAEVRHYGLDQAVRPGFYFPHAQLPLRGMTLVFRSETSDGAGLLGMVRETVRGLDHRIAATSPYAMEEIVRRSYWHRRFFSNVFAVFAVLALVLASVGVGAVVAYSVSQRTHELGVRLALGADRGAVVRLVVRDGMRPVLAGLGLGILASWGMLRWLQGEMYGVNASNPVLYCGLALGLGMVALVAAYVPGRRASEVEAMAALRCE